MILTVIGSLAYVAVLLAAWIFRATLFGDYPFIEPLFLGITAGNFILITLLPLIESLRSRELRLAWRKRLEDKEGFAKSPTWWNPLINLFQKANYKFNLGFQKGIGRALLGLWQDAGFGSRMFSFFAVVLGIIAGGGLAGYLLTGRYLLSGFVSLLLLVGFFTLLYSRARTLRQLFQDQFPGVLDRLADSLQAGFSLPQALEFVVPNLSQPSSSEMAHLVSQIQIGFSVDQALAELYQRRPNEDVRLLVEGLTLQHQVGGNMAEMMREMAEMVRKRVELTNEVRTLTAQGRLSAVVIALLVPISVGLLSMFPGYTDVLFNTTVGNLVLIAAGILEMIGALIVVRLIRIEV